MYFDDANAADPQSICYLFTDFFQSVYNVSDIVYINNSISCSYAPVNIGIPFITEE